MEQSFSLEFVANKSMSRRMTNQPTPKRDIHRCDSRLLSGPYSCAYHTPVCFSVGGASSPDDIFYQMTNFDTVDDCEYTLWVAVGGEKLKQLYSRAGSS